MEESTKKVKKKMKVSIQVKRVFIIILLSCIRMYSHSFFLD